MNLVTYVLNVLFLEDQFEPRNLMRNHATTRLTNMQTQMPGAVTMNNPQLNTSTKTLRQVASAPAAPWPCPQCHSQTIVTEPLLPPVQISLPAARLFGAETAPPLKTSAVPVHMHDTKLR